MMSCSCLKHLSLTTELNAICYKGFYQQPHCINHFQCVSVRPGSLELIYINLEFRWLRVVQLKSWLPLSKICYFDFLGQGRAADANQTICESGLSCVVETNKHNKIRTMYYSKPIITSSNLFEKRNLKNCFQFNTMKILLRKFNRFYFHVHLCGMTNKMLWEYDN